MHNWLVGEVPEQRHRPGSRAVVERDLRNDRAVWHYGDGREAIAVGDALRLGLRRERHDRKSASGGPDEPLEPLRLRAPERLQHGGVILVEVEHSTSGV